MKKLLAITLLLAMLFTMLSCRAVNMSDYDDEDDEDEEEVSDPNDLNDLSIEETVLYDADNIKATVTKLHYSKNFGCYLEVDLENNTDRAMTFSTGECTIINGLVIDVSLYCELDAGASETTELVISSDAMKTAGITIIQTIDLTIKAFDPETYDNIFESERVTLKTNADQSFVQTYNDEGTLFYEDDNIRIVFQGITDAKYSDAKKILVFIENKSDKEWTVQCEEFAINGITVDPILSSRLPAGTRVHDDITVYTEELTENNIETIDTLTVSFRIIDFNDWSTSYTAQSVTIKAN